MAFPNSGFRRVFFRGSVRESARLSQTLRVFMCRCHCPVPVFWQMLLDNMIVFGNYLPASALSMCSNALFTAACVRLVAIAISTRCTSAITRVVLVAVYSLDDTCSCGLVFSSPGKLGFYVAPV